MLVDFDFFMNWVPIILIGLNYTIGVTLMAATIGFSFGLVLALLRLSGWPIVSQITAVFIEYIRGVPPLVVLFITYYGLPEFGIEFSAFWAASVGLGVNRAVFAAEIYRAGLLGLPRGQYEAARAIGLRVDDQYRYIILPQALALVVPPLINEMIGITKDSSLASTITVPDISLNATAVVQTTFRPFEVYFVLATTYVILALLIAWFGRLVEKKLGQSK